MRMPEGLFTAEQHTSVVSHAEQRPYMSPSAALALSAICQNVASSWSENMPRDPKPGRKGPDRLTACCTPVNRAHFEAHHHIGTLLRHKVMGPSRNSRDGHARTASI